MIPHQEYTIKIHAPSNMGLCKICILSGEKVPREGEFALFVENDHEALTVDLDPLCARHLMVRVLQVFLWGPNE